MARRGEALGVPCFLSRVLPGAQSPRRGREFQVFIQPRVLHPPEKFWHSTNGQLIFRLVSLLRA